MQQSFQPRHIKLDRENVQVQRFVLSLSVDPLGSILELKGEPVLRVLPVDEHGPAVDMVKLKAAIVRRRSVSRRLNKEWDAADRETWEQTK